MTYCRDSRFVTSNTKHAMSQASKCCASTSSTHSTGTSVMISVFSSLFSFRPTTGATTVASSSVGT